MDLSEFYTKFRHAFKYDTEESGDIQREPRQSSGGPILKLAGLDTHRDTVTEMWAFDKRLQIVSRCEENAKQHQLVDVLVTGGFYRGASLATKDKIYRLLGYVPTPWNRDTPRPTGSISVLEIYNAETLRVPAAFLGDRLTDTEFRDLQAEGTLVLVGQLAEAMAGLDAWANHRRDSPGLERIARTAYGLVPFRPDAPQGRRS